jgi:hypothetical protein
MGGKWMEVDRNGVGRAKDFKVEMEEESNSGGGTGKRRSTTKSVENSKCTETDATEKTWESSGHWFAPSTQLAQLGSARPPFSTAWHSLVTSITLFEIG